MYSPELQVKRICSAKVDFLKHLREMKLLFLKRGYPENIDDQELGKVKSSEPSLRTNKKDKGVCLVATLHPFKKSVGFFIDILIYFIMIKKLKEKSFYIWSHGCVS